MSTRSGALVRRWLLVVTVVAGLVAMHHLVDLSSPHPSAEGGAAGMGPMTVAATDHAADHPAGHPSGHAADHAADHAAGHPAGHAADPCTGACCLLGHPCQAVLVDPVGLAASASVAAPVAPLDSSATTSREVPVTVAARAPPDSGTWLSQLGVQRN